MELDLLIATSNPNKLREIRGLLADVPVTLHSLAELPPVVEPEETGLTFADNARLKASYYSAHLAHAGTSWGDSALTVAEDSGLVIDALDGEPGVLRLEHRPSPLSVNPCHRGSLCRCRSRARVACR